MDGRRHEYVIRSVYTDLSLRRVRREQMCYAYYKRRAFLCVIWDKQDVESKAFLDMQDSTDTIRCVLPSTFGIWNVNI